MSKNLRYVFLSVLVVLFCVSSAFATNIKDGIFDGGTYSLATGILTINESGRYTFDVLDASKVTINAINLGADGQGNAKNVTVVLPTPEPDLASQGTTGTFNVNWPASVKNSSGLLRPLSYNNRVTLTIERRTTNSAILAAQPFNWEINKGQTFVLNAPIRVNAANNTLQVNLTVKDGGVFTFDEYAEIFANNAGPTANGDDKDMVIVPTGFVVDKAQPSTFKVEAGGELIVKNSFALRGGNLTVEVESGKGGNDERATLTFALKEGTVHDLRGIINKNGKVEVNTSSAWLKVDGNIKVEEGHDMTLWGAIFDNGAGHEDYDGRLALTKTGKGKLTLADCGNVSDPLRNNFGLYTLPENFMRINVEEGTLEFASRQSWAPRSETNNPTVSVSEGATFIANSKSIKDYASEGTNNLALIFNVSGTAIFRNHAVLNENSAYPEIYPYEDYITANNAGLTINSLYTTLNVRANAKAIIDNGAFAVGMLTGRGTVEINNTNNPSQDRGVLILTDSAGFTSAGVPANQADLEFGTNYTDFLGTINGTNANVGLYSNSRISKPPFSRRIFQSADVDIDNLIVYGDAQLNVREDTNLDGVKNIYLRGHRPGAKNFNDDGSVNNPIAYSRLTVGKLNFVPVDFSRSTIDIDGLRVDGTSVKEDAEVGTIEVLDDDPENTIPNDALPRLYVNISNIELYANKGANRDFPSAYAAPAKGIRALIINGTEQPSRITIDGTTVTGYGLEADVTDKVYQVVITDDSDVKFKGNGGAEYFPLAHNNSLYVGQDAKLEMQKGAVVDGHLTFRGSTIPDFAIPDYSPTIESGVDTDGDGNDDFYYPEDDCFDAWDGFGGRFHTTGSNIFNGWYDGHLVPYSGFTTQVGKNNRITNEGGEYSVKVTGDLTLANSRTGKVVVRVRPELDAYDGYEFSTIGQYFGAIGTTGGSYNGKYITSYNKFFQLRIPNTPAADGVTVGNRTELAIVQLGDWSYMQNGEEFGQDSGHNFSIKIPFKVIVRGEEVTVERELDRNNNTRYYLGLGSEKWYFANPQAVFVTYDDGESYYIPNVSDISENYDDDPNHPYRTLVSGDITMRAEVDFTEGEQYIRLIGTSYTGNRPVGDICVGLFIEALDPAVAALARVVTTATWLNGAVPGFRNYTLTREGIAAPDSGTQTSSASTEAVSSVDITAGAEGNVEFKVADMRRATYDAPAAATSLPTLENGVYTWKTAAVDTGVYMMTDKNGNPIKVTNVKLILFEGDHLSRTTQSKDITETTDFTITAAEGGGVIVSLPASALGDTGGKWSAVRGLALLADRAEDEGKVMTYPVSYTLHAAVTDEAETPSTLSGKTVKVGETVSGYVDYDPSVLSGDVKLVKNPSEFPSWLGFQSYAGGFGYNTKDLTGVEPGTYNFSVLAYSGENALTSPHKLYNFSVTVEAADELGLSVSEAAARVITGQTGSLTLTIIGSEADASRTVTISTTDGPAGLVALGESNKIVGNGSVTVSLNAEGVEVGGPYHYTAKAGELEVSFMVTVIETPFEIAKDEEASTGFSSVIGGRTYYATFTVSGAPESGEVEWALSGNSGLTGFKSGDKFIVEGSVAYSENAELSYTVKASSGGTAAEPADGLTEDIAVEQEDITSWTTTGYTVAAGDSNAVDTGYKVTFASNVTVAEDSVFLPSWLKVEKNADDEVTGIIYNGPAGDLANGTAAKVYVTDVTVEDADDPVNFRWDVVYAGNHNAPAESQDVPAQSQDVTPNESQDVPPAQSQDVPPAQSQDLPPAQSQDVTPNSGGDEPNSGGTVSEDQPGSVGSSGGGCDAGFGALALALAAPLFLRKRRS